MDQTENYKLQTLTQFINMQFLKKATQLVLSLSVFSFFFSHSSSLSFHQSFDFFSSAFSFKLFGHPIDKNYIFLLCNGLLVFLAKDSGLTRSLSGSNHEEESLIIVDHGLQSESSILETKETTLENKVIVETAGSAKNVALRGRREADYLINGERKEIEKSAVEEGGESMFFISEEEEEEKGVVFISEDEREQKEPVTSSIIKEEEEEEEEEEEGNEKLSTEELNKKFEDFIRRVKEELRIEAQLQLIMI